MKTTLTPAGAGELFHMLREANTAFNARTPGDPALRQPVHTVYGGAQIFRADTAEKLGAAARASLHAYAPAAGSFARALGIGGSPALRRLVYERVAEKLRREPVEDFRIDFEDGYGNRPDAEEDGHAASTAREVALGMKRNALPPFIGIRIKPFTEELKARSVRTLDIFCSTLLAETGGALPAH